MASSAGTSAVAGSDVYLMLVVGGLEHLAAEAVREQLEAWRTTIKIASLDKGRDKGQGPADVPVLVHAT